MGSLGDRRASRGARSLLDEVWYLELDEDVRVARLVARRVAHGRTEQEAQAWVLGNEKPNARRVERNRERAVLLVRRASDPRSTGAADALEAAARG